MSYPRYGCVVSTIDNYIYVIGGISGMTSKQMVSKIEVYNPNANKWNLIEDINLNIFKAASVII
jgi:hypothetical protein